jgi:rod shape-determining protein MreD
MNRNMILRVIVVFLILIVLHFTLRPALQWRTAIDFVLIATMMLSVRIRPGAAALLGFATGLLVDVQNPATLGSSALGLSAIAFGASFLKASFFSDKTSMNAALFFLGKWGYDVIFLVVTGGVSTGDSLGQFLLWSPLAAALTAAAGAVTLTIMSPMLRERSR